LIIFGGVSSSTFYNDVMIYNFNTRVWSYPPTTSATPAARYDHSAVLTEDETLMLVYGGSIDGGTTVATTVEKFVIANQTWLTVPLAAGSQPPGRSGHIAAMFNNTMVIWGGSPSDALVTYTLDNATGTPPPTFDTNPTSAISTQTSSDDSIKSPSDKSNTTAIIAGTVAGGGAVLLLLIALLLFFLVFRKKKVDNNNVEMAVSDHSSSRSNSRTNLSSGNTSRGNASTSRGHLNNNQSSNYAPIHAPRDHSSAAIGQSWEIMWEELEIDEELGRGAYGVVYKAKWRNQMVAVKRVIGEFTASQVEEFVSEADLMSKLRPHGKIYYE
jgi:hypothetical protein